MHSHNSKQQLKHLKQCALLGVEVDSSALFETLCVQLTQRSTIEANLVAQVRIARVASTHHSVHTQVARHIALPIAVRRALAESSPGHKRRLQFLHMDKLSPVSVIIAFLRACARVGVSSCVCAMDLGFMFRLPTDILLGADCQHIIYYIQIVCACECMCVCLGCRV